MYLAARMKRPVCLKYYEKNFINHEKIHRQH